MDKIPIKEWYPAYKDWLLAPIISFSKDGARELPIGEPDKFLRLHSEKCPDKPTQ